MPFAFAVLMGNFALVMSDFLQAREQKRDEAAIKEFERLDGSWEIQRHVVNGVEKKLKPGKDWNRCVIVGVAVAAERVIVADCNGVPALHDPISIDPTREPKHITLGPRTSSDLGTSNSGSINSSGSSNIVRRKGIYELKGDTLTIVLAPLMGGVSSGSTGATPQPPEVTPEQAARPKSFDLKEGVRSTLLVLKRIPVSKESKP
jgi:uncharacterized protein (TIGR03067 family)